MSAATALAAGGSNTKAELETYQLTREAELRDEIVVLHMPLAKSISAYFARVAGQSDDLQQVGFEGLIKAVERFDPTLNVPFEAYARTMIAGEISHYLRDLAPPMRSPRWFRGLNKRLNQSRDSLIAKLHREPSLDELAQDMNVTVRGVREILRLREMYSTSPAIEDASIAATSTAMEAIKSQRYVSLHLPIEDRIVLDRALEKLADFERSVVHLFFYKDLTQTQIAHRLGSSQRRVSRILRSTLRKLKEDIR